MTTPATRQPTCPARTLKSPLAAPGHSAHPDARLGRVWETGDPLRPFVLLDENGA